MVIVGVCWQKKTRRTPPGMHCHNWKKKKKHHHWFSVLGWGIDNEYKSLVSLVNSSAEPDWDLNQNCFDAIYSNAAQWTGSSPIMIVAMALSFKISLVREQMLNTLYKGKIYYNWNPMGWSYTLPPSRGTTVVLQGDSHYQIWIRATFFRSCTPVQRLLSLTDWIILPGTSLDLS